MRPWSTVVGLRHFHCLLLDAFASRWSLLGPEPIERVQPKLAESFAVTPGLQPKALSAPSVRS
jgi:hypothetical protein